MPLFNEYLAQGNAWLFFPMAVFLGALHGLEPGHSKTMMTAFIIAIRGTLAQAFLLGIAATLSHTAIIWALAFAGLHYSSSLNIEKIGPYFQLATGIVVIGIACWILYRTRQAQKEAQAQELGSHEEHHHHDELVLMPDTRSSYRTLAGARRSSEPEGDIEFGDAHERQHAAEVQKQLMNKQVTTGQIVLFGLTGGLMPCPSAFAILLVCLQLKRVVLGLALVLGFSIGLAITLVTVGVLAAISVQHAGKRFKRFGELARKVPYLSAMVLILIGLLVLLQGLRYLT